MLIAACKTRLGSDILTFQIIGFQIANVGSPDIVSSLLNYHQCGRRVPEADPYQNSTIQLQIAKAANEILCSPDSVTEGVVVTHGTDTLEETAFMRE